MRASLFALLFLFFFCGPVFAQDSTPASGTPVDATSAPTPAVSQDVTTAATDGSDDRRPRPVLQSLQNLGQALGQALGLGARKAQNAMEAALMARFETVVADTTAYGINYGKDVVAADELRLDMEADRRSLSLARFSSWSKSFVKWGAVQQELRTRWQALVNDCPPDTCSLGREMSDQWSQMVLPRLENDMKGFQRMMASSWRIVESIPLELGLPITVVYAVFFVAFSALLVFSVAHRIFSKMPRTYIALFALVLVMFVLKLVAMSFLLVGTSTAPGALPIVSVHILARIGNTMQLVIFFLFTWMWAQVAREVIPRERPVLWRAAGIGAVVLLAATCLYIIVVTSLRLVSFYDVNMPVVPDASQTVMSLFTLVEIFALLFLYIYVRSKVNASSTEGAAFKRALWPIVGLFVGSLLQVADAIALDFWNARLLNVVWLLSSVILFSCLFASLAMYIVAAMGKSFKRRRAVSEQEMDTASGSTESMLSNAAPLLGASADSSSVEDSEIGLYDQLPASSSEEGTHYDY